MLKLPYLQFEESIKESKIVVATPMITTSQLDLEPQRWKKNKK